MPNGHFVLEQSPETRKSLLIRIRDRSDSVAWSEFVAVYAPLIYSYARRRGLQDADAADVSQFVLLSIARSISGFDYDPNRGRFRSWLFTVVRNQVSKTLQKSKRFSQLSDATHDDGQLATVNAPRDDEAQWNREHEQHLFQWAVEKVREEFQERTLEAFLKVAVDSLSVATVAETLGMTPGAVYIAKSRVTSRIRQIISSIED